MHYRTLGRTGVQVSSLALGAMNFGALGRTGQGDVTAIVDAALEAGINLIDTADAYSRGESEQLVGKAIAGRRDRWDPSTSDEETLSALTDLQRAGKIRYFGSSTFPCRSTGSACWCGVHSRRAGCPARSARGGR